MFEIPVPAAEITAAIVHPVHPAVGRRDSDVHIVADGKAAFHQRFVVVRAL